MDVNALITVMTRDNAILGIAADTLQRWLAQGNDPNSRQLTLAPPLYQHLTHLTLMEQILDLEPCRAQVQLLRILLSYGASAEWMNSHGCSLLRSICSSPRLWVVQCALIQLFLDHGANINETSRGSGETSLFAAVLCTNTEWTRGIDVVRLLVSRGARIDVRRYGDTPEETAAVYLSNCASAEWRNSHGAPLSSLNIECIRECQRILRDVRLVGSYKQYINAPRKDLIVLREACLRGRASPPPGVFESLFAATTPRELTWRVLAYWRSDREPDVLSQWLLCSPE